MRPKKSFISALDEDVLDRIVKMFREHMSFERTAYASRIPPHIMRKWFDIGQKDLNEEVDSLYARLVMEAEFSRSFKAREYIKCLEENPKNWNATSWLLERCFPTEFGQYGEMLKKILDNHALLLGPNKEIVLELNQS